MFFLQSQAGTSPAEQKAFIFEKRPLLKELIEKYGDLSLKDFAIANLKNLPTPAQERQEEFLRSFHKIVASRLSIAKADEVKTQLEHYYGASSADHHGTLNSSLPTSADLMLAAAAAELNDPVLKNVVVLSCASVSLNNEDYPRGLLFHSEKNGSYELQKLSILPSNSHSSLVYGFRPYTLEEIVKIEKALHEKVRNGEVSPQEADKLFAVLTEIYKKPEILSAPSLCDQFTQINYELWEKIFKNEPQAKSLIYVDLETLVTELLLENHLQSESLIHKLIFDPSQATFLDSLTTAMEEFLRQGNLATHLFWWVNPEKNTRTKLQKKDGQLCTEDGAFSLPFTPEAVAQALRKKALMPNLLLIYTVIHLYYGFNCLGGFNQMHYLASMKEVYNRAGADSDLCQANSTLYNYGLNTLFLEAKRPALNLDLLLHGTGKTLEESQEALSKIILANAFESNWPIIYDILCNEPQP
ncbi:MAG: hypothetical protein WC777_03800 [Candidatus Gracilibacteria bacterium]|jgi:hypothetical protein